MADFDPYYKWLGIPPEEQPPNHYRLLGVKVFESDPEVIQAATDRQMTFLRSLATGSRVKDSQNLLNAVSAASNCLLVVEKKSVYDQQLRAKFAAQQAPALKKAAPLPDSQVKPLPASQVQPLQSAAPTPAAFVVKTNKPASRKSKSSNPLPIVLGLGGVAIVIVGVGLWMLVGGKADKSPERKVAAQVNSAVAVQPSVPSVSNNSNSKKNTDLAPATKKEFPTLPPVVENKVVTPPEEAGPLKAESPKIVFSPAEESTTVLLPSTPPSNPSPSNPTELPAPFKPVEGAPTQAAFVPNGVGVVGEIFVCQRILAKSRAAAVMAGGVKFAAPGRGANGIYVPPELFDGSGGTEWIFTYTRALTAMGVQVVHPFAGGHLLVTFNPNGATLGIDGSWAQNGLELFDSNLERRTRDYQTTFPFEPAEPRLIKSRLAADGKYELSVDNKTIMTAKIAKVRPLTLPDTCAGVGLPKPWPAGSAGIFIGPKEPMGHNQADDVRLRSLSAKESNEVASVSSGKPTESSPAATVSSGAGSTSPAPANEKNKTAKPNSETTDPGLPVAVSTWEVTFFPKVKRISFYDTGKTSENTEYTLSGPKNEFLAFGVRFFPNISADGMWMTGPNSSSGETDARLILRGIDPATEATEAIPTPKAKTAVGGKLTGTLENTLPDIFELVGTSNRQNRYIKLTVVLSTDHRVIERDKKLAEWSYENRRLRIKFVDPKLGEMTMTNKNLVEFTSRNKGPDGDDWTWNLQRVQLHSAWDTEEQGRMVLYSNGRMDGPTSATSTGTWMPKPDGTVRIFNFTCSITPDGTRLDGRNRFRNVMKATRVPPSAVGL